MMLLQLVVLLELGALAVVIKNGGKVAVKEPQIPIVSGNKDPSKNIRMCGNHLRDKQNRT